tara:strand:+ start:292 stop:1389 length:1098 start_codon:yes stop_codon:yes gene_type:complete
MNLDDTVKACETQGYEIALNLNVHKNCLLESNCPKAIQLRQMISDMEIPPAALLQGYALATTPDVPVNISQYLPDKIGIDGKVNIQIGSNVVPLDLTDEIKRELGNAFRRIEVDADENKRKITRMGESLFRAYIDSIKNTKNAKEIMQLDLPVLELMKHKCLVTAERGEYLIFYPVVYGPQYIYDNGKRYELAQEDRDTIKREDCWMRFHINKDMRFLSIDLVNNRNRRLEHYHGTDNNDCWGQVNKPSKWDKSVEMLTDQTRIRIGSLAMINNNSLLNRNPDGMPKAADIRRRSTLLGEEGKRAVPEPDAATMDLLRRASSGVTPVLGPTVLDDNGEIVEIDTGFTGPRREPTPAPRNWGQRND